MDRWVKLLNILAFCFSLIALVLVTVLALGWSEGFVSSGDMNTAIGCLVGGYCCSYGLAQWLQAKNRTFDMGLMVFGILIIFASLITSRLN